MTAGTVLWRALGAVRRDVAIGSVLTMVHQAAEAAVPILIGVIIDRAVATGDATALMWLTGALVALFILLSSAGCLGIYAFERTGARADHAVRVDIARRALHPGGGADAVARPGEVVSLATIDTARVGEGMSAILIAAGAVVGVAGATVVLLVTSVALGLVIVLGLPLVLVVIRVLARPLERRSAQQHAAVASASGVATDLLGGLRVLKGLGAEMAGAARYREASREALGGALRTARVLGAYRGLTLILSGAFLVVVALVGGRLAVAGEISVGELVAALGLAQFLVGPLERVAFAGAALARAHGSAGRIAALVGAPVAVRGGLRRLPVPVRGRLELRGLHAGSLSGLDLDIVPGELVGIVALDPDDGASLLACLAREREPDAGEIRLDGIALAELALDDSRRALLVAGHDADLFEGTLADNVDAAATDGRIDAAMAVAAIEDVVAALPGGSLTSLSEHGRSLSGGQRQRVALARALAADPPVLVLHEPTTAVDSVTEHRIAARVRALRAGRTTIAVTASPPLLAVADRVAVVRKGVVVASGTHDQLAAADERYGAAVLA